MLLLRRLLPVTLSVVVALGEVACSDPAAGTGQPLADSAVAADVAADAAGSDSVADAVGGTDVVAGSDLAAGTDAAQATDVAATDAVASDTGENTELPAADVVLPKGEVTAVITAPAEGTVVEAGQLVDLAGAASDTVFANTELVAVWSSSLDGELGKGPLQADGTTKLTGVALSPGQHQIVLEVLNPTKVSAQTSIAIGVCSWSEPVSFDTQLDGAKWQIYGDAYWDAGGWLEMTGNAAGKFGKIWNTVDYIKPGDVQISFDFQTGGGINGGADGFALSVIEAKNAADLQVILAAAKDGGCLGYGVSGPCGTTAVKAFHLEIDTFYNTGDPNTDPTSSNHIAVTLDGNASNHLLWASTPGIEDLQWHTVTVQVDGAKVTATLDGKPLFSQEIKDFEFRGGYIGFSGSTGWASNFHRFDNLKILQQCLVQ